MSLITAEELARGLLIGTFGGAAGLCTVAFPGSALWLLPAGLAVGGCALTVPEVRAEVARALPALPAPLRPALGELLHAPRAALARLQPPQAAHAPRRAQGGASPAGAPLRPRQWLEAVNDRPDDNPHLTVVGPSGSGKTTFVSAALGKRPGRVVVLTPKVSPGAWRGAEVVTLDDDLSYAPLAEALDALQIEAKRRSLALRRGEPLEPLTVVLDELPELAAEIPGAGKFAVRLSRWGRELGMRQVVLATSDDALNIPGWAATRSNYVRVELGRPAADGTRPAILDDGVSRAPLELGGVKKGAERAQLRPWRGEDGVTRAPAEGVTTALAPVTPVAPAQIVDLSYLLDGLLAEPVPSASGRKDTPVTVPVPVTHGTVTDTGAVTPPPSVSLQLGGSAGQFTVNLTARAEVATPPAPAPVRQRVGRRRRGPGRPGLDVRRRRGFAQAATSDTHKAELQAAYAARKAAGLSYRKSFAELGGSSEETRAWWRAAAGPEVQR